MNSQLNYLFEAIKTEEDVEKVKEKILNLAIKGELVEQNANDGDISEIIGNPNEELSKTKKYVEEGTPPPYKIPNNWGLVKIEQIASISGGSTPSKSNDIFWKGGTIPWVSPKDMKMKYIDDSIDHVTTQALDKLNIIEKGSILMVVRSGILKRKLPLGIVTTNCTINQDIKALQPCMNEISDYLYLLLQGSEQRILDLCAKKGTTVDRLIINEFSDLLFPLPPLQEQKRIIQKVNELFAICDKLAKQIIQEKEASAILNKTVFKSFQSESNEDADQAIQFVVSHMDEVLEKRYDVDLLRTGILSLAMRGKLVPQNISEEPASNLLARIEEEKHRLIKDEKMKNSKTTSKVNLNEVPFELPHQWEWTKLGDYASMERGVTFPASAKKEILTKNGVLCATTSSIQTSFLPRRGVYIDSSYVKSNRKFVQENDVLISLANSYELVGKTCIATNINEERITFGGFVGALRPLVIDPYFFYLVTQYLYKTKALQELSSQTTNIANLSGEKLKNVIVPCPPLEEQKRIASKVQELFRICDNLENHLLKRQNEKQKLISNVI